MQYTFLIFIVVRFKMLTEKMSFNVIQIPMHITLTLNAYAATPSRKTYNEMLNVVTLLVCDVRCPFVHLRQTVVFILYQVIRFSKVLMEEIFIRHSI